ncbi:hypothetical protein [uncultured Brevibacterium sp.]|uniref:hypothetical protein n=1 Tax=uncultured Brevibacterium sp. TaxID=189678 RepID=UPI0025FC58D4|nr:hypothetical protein [uncultured Brevibacterium sp.]
MSAELSFKTEWHDLYNALVACSKLVSRHSPSVAVAYGGLYIEVSAVTADIGGVMSLTAQHSGRGSFALTPAQVDQVVKIFPRPGEDDWSAEITVDASNDVVVFTKESGERLELPRVDIPGTNARNQELLEKYRDLPLEQDLPSVTAEHTRLWKVAQCAKVLNASVTLWHRSRRRNLFATDLQSRVATWLHDARAGGNQKQTHEKAPANQTKKDDHAVPGQGDLIMELSNGHH